MNEQDPAADIESEANANLRRDAAFERYITLLQKLLFDCQHIEEGLRFYISVAYRKIRARIGSGLTFKYDESDVRTDALGTLIRKFERLSDDVPLIERLKTMAPLRNRYAHAGFVVDFRSTVPEGDIQRMIDELSTARALSAALVAEIYAVLRVFADGQD